MKALKATESTDTGTLTRPWAASQVGRIGNPSYNDERTARASYGLRL